MHSGPGLVGFMNASPKGSFFMPQVAESGLSETRQHVSVNADNPHASDEIKDDFVQFVLGNLMALWMCIPGAFFPCSSHYFFFVFFCFC